MFCMKHFLKKLIFPQVIFYRMLLDAVVGESVKVLISGESTSAKFDVKVGIVSCCWEVQPRCGWSKLAVEELPF